MSRAYNKVTQMWTSTDTDPTIVNDPNWIIDPVFDNEEWANQIGPAYWTFSGNSVITPTVDAYNATMLPIIQNNGWELIKAERDRRKIDGGYKVGTNWYHSDTFSRTQQIGLVMLGANLPNNVMWKTMSGSFVLMTPTLALQIFQSAMVSDMTIFATAEQKKAAMLASPDPSTYDYLSGWPKCYGE